jgi:hypothetical protein
MTDKAAGLDALPGNRSDEQISRLADLVADGRFDFPQDLTPTDTERLHRAVRSRLRQRLLGFIARAVAQHLHRAGQPDPERTPHA